MNENPPNQPQIFSVSEISNNIKRKVESEFRQIRVRGEVSGAKRAASGHVYFNLKDESAVLNAICWKGVASKINFAIEDGLEVICSGKISTYSGRSSYQIIISSVEVAGEGALMALLEKRKKAMAAKGLFDADRKKKLPFMPQIIGVVTSPTGAVIQDILHRIGERFPVQVIVWPVLVQGEGAAGQIANAIDGFNNLTEHDDVPVPDLLIIARGGGSLEDLWAFNEEIVVMAASNSKIPLISAIGHETDTTLIDYVADRRAPTPTGAAEIAVPVRQEWICTLLDYQKRQILAINRLIDEKKSYISALSRGLLSPSQLLESATQRLDDWTERLNNSLPNIIKDASNSLKILSDRFKPELIQRQIQNLEQKLQFNSQLLDSYHYKKIIQRGFALVRDADGQIIRSSKITDGMKIKIEVSDGKIQAVTGSLLPKVKKKNKGKNPVEQGNLF